MSKSARIKGHSYERKIKREFNELGFINCNTSRNENRLLDAKGVDLTNTGCFNVQCKAVERGLNIRNVLSAMPADDKYNVVFHKVNRQVETVTMTKADFYKILTALKYEE